MGSTVYQGKYPRGPLRYRLHGARESYLGRTGDAERPATTSRHHTVQRGARRAARRLDEHMVGRPQYATPRVARRYPRREPRRGIRYGAGPVRGSTQERVDVERRAAREYLA